ncbi:MAG: VCBS repeat-containing protein [Anaerolineales bacterium]|nr:VCBS repeat-containing protein [Anaerolineales bacterium]
MPPTLRRALLGLHRLGLRLYPRRFRAEFEAEMKAVFAEALAEAAKHGWLSVGALCAHELAGLLHQAARERVYAAQLKPARVAQTNGGPQLFSGGPWLPRVVRGVLITALAAAVILVGLPAAFLWAWARAEQSPQVNQVALADLNGDGHLDALLAVGHGNLPFPTYVLYNDGAGQLGATTHNLGTWPGFAAAAGDVTGDGWADALLDTSGGGLLISRSDDGSLSRPVWLTEPGPLGVMRLRPVLGDLNGDGRLDLFAAGCCGRDGVAEMVDGDPTTPPQLPYSEVWVQGPRGGLLPGRRVGELGSNAAALADLNGDGSLDVFLANGHTLHADGQVEMNTPNTVWFNDGQANFADSGQRLGQTESTAVALGDLNGDGHADAVVGHDGPAEVWWNDGRGTFTDSGQRLGSGPTTAVFLADLDRDGDLDLLAAGDRQARVWFNDGQGSFAAGSRRLSFAADAAVAVGDLTGDGAADVLIARPQTSQVWRNDGRGRLNPEPWVQYP